MCPFSGGVSLSSGLIGDGYDKIPNRLAWISGNPYRLDDPMPKVESVQLILAPRGGGSPRFEDEGRIFRTEAGAYGFSGKFKFGGVFKMGHSLTEDEKELLIQDFEKDRAKLLNIYPQLSFVPPAGLGDELLGCNNDADFDGIDNAGDNCPNTHNPKQELLCK